MTEQLLQPLTAEELAQSIKNLAATKEEAERTLTRRKLLFRLLNPSVPSENSPSHFGVAAVEPKDLDIGLSVFKAIDAHREHPSMVALDTLYESGAVTHIEEREELNRLERAAAVLLQYTAEHDL